MTTSLPADPTERVAIIDRVAERLRRSQNPEEQWVGEGLGAWANSDVDSLEHALGVGQGPGERDPRTVVAVLRRDEAVCQAAKCWPSVRALAEALARYRAGAWLKDRIHRTCPPRLADRDERHLWEILRERDRPLSKSAIHAIVQNAPPSKWTPRPPHRDDLED